MNLIKAEVLAIGDELLYGQTLDTNSHFISKALDKASIKVVRRTTIGDREDEILTAFAEAESRADIVLITGGLGPTSDDLTKPCLAKYFDCELQLHAEALKEVSAFFERRGRELTDINRQQAMLPACCEKITNPIGTAPGMWFERNGKVFVSMPGVPHEMRRMVDDEVVPKLLKTFRVPTIIHQMIRTAGIGESFLAEKIAPWEKSLPEDVKLAYLPSEGGVKLRLTMVGDNADNMRLTLRKLTDDIHEYAGEYIFGYDDDPLESVVGKLLAERGLTLAVAESCTGGYLSHLITSIPGSSTYFQGSVIPYSYPAKEKVLGINHETLEKYGAVSEQTITEMATNVRLLLNTDIGVATSGIAGPGGATSEKPVGTVWIAYADGQQVITKKLQLASERLVNIKLSTTAVLNLIRQQLEQPVSAKK